MKDMLPSDMAKKVVLALEKVIVFASIYGTSISDCGVVNRVDMAAKVLQI